MEVNAGVEVGLTEVRAIDAVVVVGLRIAAVVVG